VPTYISATDDLTIDSSENMDPHGRGRVMPGRARGSLTVYELGEECSDTLPTVNDFLTKYIDEETGLIDLKRIVGLDLKIDPAPLRQLDPSRRVSPGYSFVTNEALRKASAPK
jgi:hypothetical protein